MESRTFSFRHLLNRLRSDRYFVTCTVLIFVWLGAWLLSFPNIYGWLTDDIFQFARVKLYETGGQNLVDIQWFHAFDWFIVLLPWVFHWSFPSHMIPQAWERTGEFRALILYVIFLHGVLLAMIAYFMRQLCGNPLVCIGALLLFMTSPTFVFYTDLIDSRYLGLVAGVPALSILLSQRKQNFDPLGWPALLYGFALPGFLIGLGQSIHYTLLYFAGAISLVYFVAAYVEQRSRHVLIKLIFFTAGLLAWFVPVQLLSLEFHPFDQSMLGTMFGQVNSLGSHYDQITDIASWLHFFIEEMGIPMMAAVVAGAVLLIRDDTRPQYISRFDAYLMLGSTAIMSVYILTTRSVPFYRQVSAYQIFYMLFALVAIDVGVRRLRVDEKLRWAAALAAFCIIAYVPSVLRAPEVFIAAQGLGRAVNFAHKLTRENNVYFIEFYDIDLHPHSIIARHDFDSLKPGDYLVTDFPTTYFVKYPDLFALMHEAKPVASFPTEWCTHENWVEERTYWEFRRYQDEPESCNSQVYSVKAIRQAEATRSLKVTSLAADSSISPNQQPFWAFTLRNPRVPINNFVGSFNRGPIFENLWSSAATPGPHWLEMTFARTTMIGAATLVPVNYLAPTTYTEAGRPQSVQIYGSSSRHGPMRLVWSGNGLRDDAIVSANFAPVPLAKVRFVLTQPTTEAFDYALITEQRLPASVNSGIEFIHFPGYSVTLDPRILPKPAHRD